VRVIEIPADALVILVAPAGAGKSTFARQHFRPIEIVSSDRCRALVADDEGEQRATAPAFEVFDAIVRGRMQMGRLTVADATNLEAGARLRLREMARASGRPVVCIVLDVPPGRTIAQNLGRARRVPPHVIDLHYVRFNEALPVLEREGYHAVIRVRAGEGVRVARRAGAAPIGGGSGASSSGRGNIP
jgi:protein phosphatase